MAKVSEVFIYPVKSCAGISLAESALDRFGPVGDRRWLVTDTQGNCLTQREYASMALLQAAHTPQGLELVAPEASISVAQPLDGDPSTVTVWGDRMQALDAGAAAADWLSHYLGTSCRLVYMPDHSKRYVDTDYAAAGETVSFADGFPLLLISQTALDELNARLPSPVPMDRFRPNIVIEDCPPHAEDSWQRIRIGTMEFDVAKPCARCVMPSIDQATAGKDPDILRTLAAYRRWQDDSGTRQIFFGQNLLDRGEGTIRTGDSVEVILSRP